MASRDERYRPTSSVGYSSLAMRSAASARSIAVSGRLTSRAKSRRHGGGVSAECFAMVAHGVHRWPGRLSLAAREPLWHAVGGTHDSPVTDDGLARPAAPGGHSGARYVPWPVEIFHLPPPTSPP